MCRPRTGSSLLLVVHRSRVNFVAIRIGPTQRDCTTFAVRGNDNVPAHQKPCRALYGWRIGDDGPTSLEMVGSGCGVDRRLVYG